MLSQKELATAHCQHATVALTDEEIAQYLKALPEWKRDGQKISRSFDFKNYYETLAFVNAGAFIFHNEDHHPELTVTYKQCVVRFDTHSVNQGNGGISINDFICAAKLDHLHRESTA